MDNAFESSDAAIPEVEEPIKSARLVELNAEIMRIQGINRGLRDLNLHRTADINTAKLQKLLSEKRELENDAARE